ncbi:MAG: protein kinase, partial [Chthoniobacter sp.]|uniref:protein kinase domain-containing protein n=1 Tax=Chthoniobacter sp. TaxID=2510640 RepID=UPI0032A87053
MSTNDPNPSPDTPASTGFSEGQTLAGCYALSRPVSVGDGTEVWLANDEVLGKDVTLHFLPAAVAKDSRALQELRADVKRDRQLIHPQILRVYDLIEEPEWAAISMNAFEGESLAVRLAKQADKRLTVAEMEPWIYQLVQTVEDAHKINFLHRDLAPQNIFLTAAGQLLVANFGISRTIQDAFGRAGTADETRRAFASPQTLEGSTPARTDDVYSLGAVLYALLAGTPPTSGADVAALGKPELHVPPAWRQAIAAALQKSPEDRPPTASEFLKRLKAEVSEPTPVAPAAAVMEKSATPLPVAVEVPVAKVESTPVKEVSRPPAKVEAEKIIPVEEPEPEVEIIPSKALGVSPKTRKPEPKPAPEPIQPPARPEPKKTLERSSVGDFKPRLYPEESRFPIVIAAIAALCLLAAVIWHFSTSGTKSGAEVAVATPAPATPGPTPEQKELHALATTPPPPVVVTTQPKITPAPQTPAPATPVPEEVKALADKQAALDKAKQVAQAAEKARADLLKLQQEADAAVAESQKAVGEQRKTYSPIKSAADEAVAQRKKLADDQKAAEAAAQEAQKIAAER